MDNKAQHSFELGKRLLKDENKPEEAAEAFSQAVESEPNIAQYRAWYAQALVVTKQYEDALREAGLAIQLDPSDGKGYRMRGFAFKGLGNIDSAIADFSSAIRIDPTVKIAYRERMALAGKNHDWQQYLIDRFHYRKFVEADHFSWNPPGSSNPKIDASFTMINEHFKHNVAPKLDSSSERTIDYWPILAMVWDRRDGQIFISGGSLPAEYGIIGQGYICLSDQYLRIVSLSELPNRYRKSRGASLIGFFLPVPDRFEPSKQDHFWKIAAQDIRGAQNVTDETLGESVRIDTTAQSWFILPYYDFCREIIITALDMARFGQFTESARDAQGVQEQDVVELIKQLGELKNSGLITETEYESKKKELLSRL